MLGDRPVWHLSGVRAQEIPDREEFVLIVNTGNLEVYVQISDSTFLDALIPALGSITGSEQDALLLQLRNISFTAFKHVSF